MTDTNSKDGDRCDRSRALVLGGGGPVGRAWQIGLVDGLVRQGIDLGAADLIIGTSADAVVGGHLALNRGVVSPETIALDASSPPVLPSGSMADIAAAMARAAQSPEPELIRAEVGKMALHAETISEEASVSRSMFSPFVGQTWPNNFQVVTVNARTGQLQIWEASSGVSLAPPIAASTAAPGIWPPITLNGERYIDGGVRSILNADLAIGFDIVIAVSCFAVTARHQAEVAFFKALNAAVLLELDAIRNRGASLVVIEPNSEFLVLTRHGAAMLDNNLAPEAYRLGHITAMAHAESVRSIWNSY